MEAFLLLGGDPPAHPGRLRHADRTLDTLLRVNTEYGAHLQRAKLALTSEAGGPPKWREVGHRQQRAAQQTSALRGLLDTLDGL